MKMPRITGAIGCCLMMMAGCNDTYETTFLYTCNPAKTAISRIETPSFSVSVQDNRGIRDTKLLGKYPLATGLVNIVATQNPPDVIKDAVCKELMCQGHTINEDSPVKIQIVLNEMCLAALYTWSLDVNNNFGVVNADISIINKGKTIYSTNIQTTLKSSEDGKGGDVRAPASSLLYEFTQDVLSDKDLIDALTTIK
jgi:uncharacterized lipoprotein YajG